MAKESVKSVSREQLLAFRLAGQHLTERLSAGKFVEAASRVGIRNSPPGSAEMAFHARVKDFSTEKLDAALADDKTLLEVWSIRSSPYFFPVRDTPIFATGLLPFDDEGLLYALKGFIAKLDLGDHSAVEALEIIAKAAAEALENKPLNKGELSTAVSQAVPKGFLYWCNGCQAFHVPETFFRLAIQKAGICFVPRNTSKDLLFIRADQWLGKPLPDKDPAKDRQEALRRYLGCYSPSTATDFASWAGLSLAEGKKVWLEIASELVEVEFEKSKGWMLEKDLKGLEQAKKVEGVRLLPPYDAYLMATDRTTLIPDKKLHGDFWKALGNPGAVLADGEIVGNWRPQKKGKKLTLIVTPITAISARSRREIQAEAELLAPLKGATSVEVTYEE